jgi:hypothetical protein
MNPAFTYIKTCRKMPQETDFIYLGNKKIYIIFKTCWMSAALFCTKCSLFHNFIYFCLNNTFYIIRMLKFKCVQVR